MVVSVIAMSVGAALLVACSDTDSETADRATTSAPQATTSTTAAGWAPPECAIERPAAPDSVAVDGTPGDHTVTSFDGTELRVHWYPAGGSTAAAPHPTLLMGPGWGSPGATAEGGTGLFGDLAVSSLRDGGYNVLTWDPRGFGASSGTITIDSAEFEGRDVQTLIDWVSAQPEVQLDAVGDPRMGMLGGSYGGGIQLVTAALDCRVDAIVPTIAWHSLDTSLYKAETVKQGWGDLLYGIAAGRQLDPHITSAWEAGHATGVLDDADRTWFADRGPDDLVADIAVPTLIVQGTVDTLFTLDEGVTNFTTLRDRGVPVAMLWYCGGHGACLTEAGDTARAGAATRAWLDRWVRGDETTDLAAPFEFVDQFGTSFTASDYPPANGTALGAEGAGSLSLLAEGGAGPSTPTGEGSGVLDTVALAITPARATNAVEVAVTNGGDAPVTVVGAPRLTFTYVGSTPAGDAPTRVFAQLVDDDSGLVLGNQITPIAVDLDGTEHTVEVPLEMVAHTLAPGSGVTLQLVAATTAYAKPRFGGTIDFSAIAISLPVAADLARR